MNELDTTEADLGPISNQVSQNGFHYKVEVEKDHTLEVTDRVLTHFNVSDISIEDPPVEQVFDFLFQTAKWPVTVYPEFIRVLLTFVIPVAWAVTVPAATLAGHIPLSTVQWSLLIPVGFCIGARLFWLWGIDTIPVLQPNTTVIIQGGRLADDAQWQSMASPAC